MGKRWFLFGSKFNYDISNKPDAHETVRHLISDLTQNQAGPLTGNRSDLIKAWLKEKKIDYVPYEDWKIIDSKEQEDGQKMSKPREKIISIEEMLKVIKEQTTVNNRTGINKISIIIYG